MERNRLLSYSLYFFRFFQVILILSLIGLTYLIIHYSFDPEAFTNIRLIQSAGGSLEWTSRMAGSSETQGKSVYLSDIRPFAVYLMYLQASTIIFLSWLIIREFSSVIRSLQQLQTFRSRNVESFRKMAKYFLVIFILSSVSFFMAGDTGNIRLDIQLKFALLGVASFILSEIFKEGNRLYEEEQLTV